MEILMKWIATFPHNPVPYHISANSEAEARRNLRKKLRVSRLPAGAIFRLSK